VSQRVAGVFLAPLELTAEKDAINRRIARVLDRAQIPFVLLDHCYLPYPERSRHDLVGIDNRQASYIATSHLLGLGVRQLVFVGEERSANTLEARIAGFHEALRNHGTQLHWNAVWRGNPPNEAFVREILGGAQPEGIICGNDLIAAQLIQTLLGLGIRIPEDIRIVGMDDVPYANLISVPLTTVRQDCAGIGAVAMATMRERLEHPNLPIRDVLVPVRLVVRRSCGSHLAQKAPPVSSGEATEPPLSGEDD
jgi:DNA-binding LacI/PurR family transcriptional regulator